MPVRGGRVFALSLLALVAVATYAPNLHDYFVGDDFDLIGSFQDKPISYFVGLVAANESGDVWASLGITGAQGHGYLRPVKIWLLKLNDVAGGHDPRAFHVTATLLFATLPPLAFLILRRLGTSAGAALVAGWIVAVHPVFSHIVPFITATEETLAAALSLAAFLLFLRMRQEGASACPVLVAYGLALLSKESAAAFVALPLLWDVLAAPDRARWRLWLPFYAGLGLVVAAYLGLRRAAFGNVIGGEEGVRFFAPAAAALFHARLWASLGGVSPAVMLGAALVVAFALAKRGRDPSWRRVFLFVGPAWYGIATVLLQGLYFDERHHALPLVGLALAFGFCLDVVLASIGPGRRLPAIVLVLAGVTFGFLPATRARANEWREASGVVERVRAQIARLTADLPDGARVLLVNTPQRDEPPYYFGWSLQAALRRPFTPEDTAARLRVFDALNVRLNQYPISRPRRFEAEIEFSSTRPGELERFSRRDPGPAPN